jgi:Uma2 family endonuclease
VGPIVIFPGEHADAVVRVPCDAATLDGFRRWATSADFPERGEISFIEGEVFVDMSPENLDLHNFLKGEISSVIRNVLRENDLGRLFYDRCLLTNPEAQLSTEPDAMFLSHASAKQRKATFIESSMAQGSYIEVVGTPDWVLEVISPTSAKKDKDRLRKAYFHAGIKEYWIANALGKNVELLVLVRGNKKFVSLRPRDGWYRSPTFERLFRLSRRKAKDGLWDYNLQVK